MTLFDRILESRGLDKTFCQDFLLPDYNKFHDPFLLPDMEKAVQRLKLALERQEKIIVYGDYDIDGLTATALILDAFKSFGFENVNAFMPNRFIEGYGLTVDAVEAIASGCANLILTVDCGSLSEKEIIRAGELGVDVIVTDHHNVADVQPPAVAVVNPKRTDHDYPFIDLAGVGVAFKLVQAMQTRFDGLPSGQEKWLLDLVALGTVCDVVPLVDENRTNVYWGLKVLARTKRPGLRALLAVAKIDTKSLNSRSLGFGLGPRMNAAGRLETAQHALDMLISDDSMAAFENAQYLDSLNIKRKADQAKILKEAILKCEKYSNDPVIVVSDRDWNHGIVGIVASKLLERYRKPAFVMQEMGEITKGSARSYGDFSAAEAIKVSREVISKGGGHKLAAGVTLPTKNVGLFRDSVNEFYRGLKLTNQEMLLLPKADASAELAEVNEELIGLLAQLEPFGHGNPQPIIKTDNLLVTNFRKMGDSAQHVKLELQDEDGLSMWFLAFNAPDYFFVDNGTRVSIWYHPDVNEWQGRKTVEGRLLHLEVIY
ncbi:single-stranded-DNA-specific exonuclease RecJ [Candidatus Saccharibacteria bacterium HGW-Saccharibacteria-1]|jgi:single-stranded-DNA-specific exonuclease|nr:MAG: single-stranded-DNA-specific exonuclease RecJ [Candidatus Saccharibacteria bacterium HGW-Saccharibacteria-1]